MEFALGAGRGLVAEHLVLKRIMDLMQPWTHDGLPRLLFVAVILDSTLQKKGIKNLEHDSMDLVQTQN
jgi:hypothetical protein